MASSAWAILWGNRPPLLRKPSDTQYAAYVGFRTTLWCTRRRPALRGSLAAAGTGPTYLTCGLLGIRPGFSKGSALWALVPGLGTTVRAIRKQRGTGPDRSGIGPREAETYPLQLRAAPALQG